MGHFTQKWLLLLIYRSFSLWMTKNDYGHRTTGLDDRNETKMRGMTGEGQNEIITQTAKSLPLSTHFDVIWHMTLRVRDWQSESDLDSICNSCNVYYYHYHYLEYIFLYIIIIIIYCWTTNRFLLASPLFPSLDSVLLPAPRWGVWWWSYWINIIDPGY